MIEILMKGGIVIPFILLCSIIAIGIILERLLFFWRIKVDEDKLINRLKGALEKKHFDEALSICDNNPSPITNLMKVGIEHRNYDPKVLRDSIMDAANMEIPKMERNLSALGTIANITPLLGLLGTILGNIDAFGILSATVDFGNTSLLANGISEALISTAAGIIVSIPAIIFYNYLVSKVNHIIIRLENKVNELVLLLGGR